MFVLGKNLMENRDLLRVLAAALLTAAVATGCGETKSGQIRSAADVARTITIDPDVGEVFAPPPKGAAPAMTAEEAWAAYDKVDASAGTAIPSDVSVSLGLLTLPLGPSGPNGTEAYTANNVLAYGFSWHSCPASHNPKVKKLPANPCREWNFLNGNTGKQIDNTWQQ